MLTTEEKKALIFLLTLFFCGLILGNLAKSSQEIKKFTRPCVELTKLNLNRVSLEELDSLKCIPKKLSLEIINYRNARQKGFESIEELKEIKGIGPKRYQRLKELFFLE